MGLKSFWQYKTCLKYSLVHLQVMTIRHLFVREYECFVLRLCIFYRFFYRDVGNGRRGAGVACPLPPDFSRSVSPISTRGSELYPPDYYSPPHRFSELPTYLILYETTTFNTYLSLKPMANIWRIPSKKSLIFLIHRKLFAKPNSQWHRMIYVRLKLSF